MYNRVRVFKKIGNSGAAILTNLVSAFWHGFYPSYYLMFFFFALVTEIAKDLYKLSKNATVQKIFDENRSYASPVVRNILVLMI